MTIATFPLAGRAAKRSDRSRAAMLAGFAAYAALLAAAWWGLVHLVPDRLSLRLMGHALNLHNLHDKILGNAAMVLLLLPAALWLECVVVGWEKSSCRALLTPSASMKTDLAVFVLDQTHMLGLIGKVMMLGASVISGVALRDWLAVRTGFVLDGAAMPLWLQVPVYFAAYSFFDYWAHRLGHTRWFWPLHRYHHAAEDFCVINGGRLHPAGFVGLFLINVPLPLLGATPEAMIWVNIAVTGLG
ncbi:MAG TPA: sterol desaturase family protein, partial [Rhizomicrobium sp.]